MSRGKRAEPATLAQSPHADLRGVDIAARFKKLNCGDAIASEIHEDSLAEIAGGFANAALIVTKGRDAVFGEPACGGDVALLRPRAVEENDRRMRSAPGGNVERTGEIGVATGEMDLLDVSDRR